MVCLKAVFAGGCLGVPLRVGLSATSPRYAVAFPLQSLTWVKGLSLSCAYTLAHGLSRPGVRQPILTQYCDGRQVSCEGWMTQWGSCDLGKQGYSPIEILRYFYGDSIYINTAEQISGIPASWPGSDLSQGSSGSKVRQLQEQLDAIATVYTAIPRVAPDGIYGPRTAAAVREFQSIFGLPQTGAVDFATWYRISHIYVGITRMAELI